MASLSAIRAQIKAVLESVPDVGIVHDYERFASTRGAMAALYKSGDRIKGWWFDRTATREADLDLGAVRRVHTWRLVGYVSLDDADATGKTLQDLVEAIAAAFRAARTLGGTVMDSRDMGYTDGPAGVQVDAIEPVMFADILCHRATLRLVTETIETV
jgi:hypothetical protein